MKAGQKFVCVVHSSLWKHVPGSGPETNILPIKGEIYTLHDWKSDDDQFTSGVGLSFDELGHDEWFDSGGFRPVDESFGKNMAEKLEKHFISIPEQEPVPN